MRGVPIDPAWRGPLTWYLFLGGIAAGSYVLATLCSLLGREPDWRATRTAYFLAFPLVAACSALRFNLGPVSAQAGWAELAVFGAFCFGSFFQVVIGRPEQSWLVRTTEATGAVAALVFVVSMGRLLPGGWISPIGTGAVLIASAATTGAATVVLLARRRSVDGDDDDEAVGRLGRVNGVVNVVELAVLAVLALSVRSPDGLAFMRWPGSLIPLFVVPVGLVLPLIVSETKGQRGETDSAMLTLFGGFVFCVAFVGIPKSLLLR